jgi:predicted metalloprotease with PDZ domain
MRHREQALVMAALVFASALVPTPAPAQAPPTHKVALHVDATDAPQGILRMHETFAVIPGALTLVYPRWVPGEHAPNGPIANVVDLTLRAGATNLTWQRDPVNLDAFHVEVPQGVSSLEVEFAFVNSPASGSSLPRLSTPNMLCLEWNKVVLTPQADDQRTVVITPSITLPSPAWKYASALETNAASGAEISFKPVTLETLVDSPLDAGTNARTFALGTWDGAPVSLAAFADTPEELAASDETVKKLRGLVAQMHALYGNRHFRHYTFLLTLSDEMPGEGLEHHESSNNGTVGDFLTSAPALVTESDLLPHEFNHSWDGKYRRPVEMTTPNLQAPMIDAGLWVYEGMTQFYGQLQAARAGLRNEQQFLDGLALAYAQLDTEHGRLADPLIDTAIASSIRRGMPAWSAERRSQDYYSEGELLWLEADVITRRRSGGKRSLDHMARAFFGAGHDTDPQVVPYTRDDIIAALNAVQPYDWRSFLAQRLDAIAPHPPNPFAAGGYRFVYGETPSGLEKIGNEQRKMLDMRYSLGIVARRDGTIVDVLTDSPAGRAKLAPGMKILAVDERTLKDQEQIDAALKAAKQGAPVTMIVVGGDVYRSVSFDYHAGPRYPHLERVPGTPDVLGDIAKPLPPAP